MKNKLLLFILCNFIAASSFSQSPSGHVKVQRDYVSVKRDVTKIIHEYKPTDALWVGIPNRIKVEVSDSTVKRLLVNVDHGSVEQKGEDFIITVDTPGVVKMSVYNYTDIRNPKLIETVNMKAVLPAEVVATLAGKKAGEISKKELMGAKSLEIECPACKDEQYEITSYQVLFAGKDIKTYQEDTQGNTLTERMKTVLSSAPKGAELVFQFIKARQANDYNIRSIAPIHLTLAD